MTSPGRTPREERLLAAKSQLEMEVFELKATVKDLKVNDTRKVRQIGGVWKGLPRRCLGGLIVVVDRWDFPPPKATF